jgi:RNA polymerase sigma-70 factor (ECF subfamily)
MRQAMQQLPPQCREALTLRLQSRMSYEEIAKVLDVPVGTVRSRLHTAVSRLRQIMIPKPAPTVAEEDAP